jgi:hypothetical protein
LKALRCDIARQLQREAASLIQNQSRRIDEAAAAAIEIASKVIRTKAEELKQEVQNSCSQKSLSRILQSQAEHLARLAELCAVDDADSCPNYEQSMHRVAGSVPYPSPKSCGIFYPAIAEIAAISKFMFLGRVVGGLDNDKVGRANVREGATCNVTQICSLTSRRQIEAARRVEGQDGIHKAAERGSDELVALHISADANSVNALSGDLRWPEEKYQTSLHLLRTSPRGYALVVELVV